MKLSKRKIWASFDVVYHGTDQKSADNIKKHGVQMDKSHKGYFGRAFYVTENKSLAQSNYADFSDGDEDGVVLTFKISPSAKILDLRKSEDWDKWKAINPKAHMHKDDFNSYAIKHGIDGVYDNSMDGIAIYNPRVLKPA